MRLHCSCSRNVIRCNREQMFPCLCHSQVGSARIRSCCACNLDVWQNHRPGFGFERAPRGVQCTTGVPVPQSYWLTVSSFHCMIQTHISQPILRQQPSQWGMVTLGSCTQEKSSVESAYRAHSSNSEFTIPAILYSGPKPSSQCCMIKLVLSYLHSQLCYLLD